MIYLYTIYYACAIILCCFGLFCACEPCVEKFCYNNNNKKKVIPI